VAERFDANGAWATPPVPWAEAADDRMVAQQLAERVRSLLPELPDAQRQVLLLRDIEGLPPADVCALLEVTEGNQRVLLHRARVHLRQQLDLEMHS
jgi:RNA polymerase sigma-70 factor (ECF subfamily)